MSDWLGLNEVMVRLENRWIFAKPDGYVLSARDKDRIERRATNMFHEHGEMFPVHRKMTYGQGASFSDLSEPERQRWRDLAEKRLWADGTMIHGPLMEDHERMDELDALDAEVAEYLQARREGWA